MSNCKENIRSAAVLPLELQGLQGEAELHPAHHRLAPRLPRPRLQPGPGRRPRPRPPPGRPRSGLGPERREPTRGRGGLPPEEPPTPPSDASSAEKRGRGGHV